MSRHVEFQIMVDFKGSHYPKEVVLYAVFFYVRYAVSYRDLEEILAERGVAVDHATLNRWVVKYSPLIACQARCPKSATSRSWRMDETYIQVKCRWTYFYRAVDNYGKTFGFMLSEHRDEAAASAFFARTIDNNGWPEKVVINKSGANLAGLQNTNWLLLLHGWFWLIEICQVKYLNNLIEQDHRFIKKLTRPMNGFKSSQSASNIKWHRGGSHDPQAAIFNQWPIRIPTIRCARRISVSSDRPVSGPCRNLRPGQLPTRNKPLIGWIKLFHVSGIISLFRCSFFVESCQTRQLLSIKCDA